MKDFAVVLHSYLRLIESELVNINNDLQGTSMTGTMVSAKRTLTLLEGANAMIRGMVQHGDNDKLAGSGG